MSIDAEQSRGEVRSRGGLVALMPAPEVNEDTSAVFNLPGHSSTLLGS